MRRLTSNSNRVVVGSHQSKMLAGYSADSVRNSTALALLLLGAFVFFLWMWLATEGFKQIVDAGCISELKDASAQAVGYRFGEDWRHGLAGGWPLYMPGFFATSVALWFWSRGRSARRLLIEAITVMSVAVLIATILAPLGTESIRVAFQDHTGLHCEHLPVDAIGTGAILGLLTLGNWGAIVIAVQHLVAKRSIRFFALPIIASSILAMVRPGDLYVTFVSWGQRAIQVDVVAIFSLFLIPVVVAFLVHFQWLKGRS